MFQVRSPILNFFWLVLRVFFDSALDTINKGSRVSEILFQKGFKLELGNRIYSLSLVPKFMLMPADVDWPAEDRGCKRDTVGVGSTGGLKMVLTVLAKLVAINVGFSIVQVGKTGFERTFLRPLVGSATSLRIHKDFHELLKVRIGVLGRHEHRSRRGRGSTRGGGSGNTIVGGRRSRQWKTTAIGSWRSLSISSGLVSTGSGGFRRGLQRR